MKTVHIWVYWIIRDLCCSYYKEILENFSEIISVILEKDYEEILEKFWKIIGNPSCKVKRKTFL